MGLQPFTRYKASFISREFKISRQLTQSVPWNAQLACTISLQWARRVPQATTRCTSPSQALQVARICIIL